MIDAEAGTATILKPLLTRPSSLNNSLLLHSTHVLPSLSDEFVSTVTFVSSIRSVISGGGSLIRTIRMSPLWMSAEPSHEAAGGRHSSRGPCTLLAHSCGTHATSQSHTRINYSLLEPCWKGLFVISASSYHYATKL